MALGRSIAITVVLVVLPSFISGQTKPRSDVWGPLRHLVGKWEGMGNGQPGISKVQREYRLVLDDKFLRVENRSIYDPQPKNLKGEVNEDWGMISFDKRRKQFVMRQFHGRLRESIREYEHKCGRQYYCLHVGKHREHSSGIQSPRNLQDTGSRPVLRGL